jgi:hypothetical protein
LISENSSSFKNDPCKDNQPTGSYGGVCCP